MSTRSKLVLILALGLLAAPEVLAWSWNQPRPYNGFQGYAPAYRPYGYRPVYPGAHRGYYRPYGFNFSYSYGYRPSYGWRPPAYGYSPAYRPHGYYPGCRY
jgi:hypothetical protein